MLTIAMTAPTPMIIPNAVRAERNFVRAQRAQRDLERGAKLSCSTIVRQLPIRTLPSFCHLVGGNRSVA